VRLEELGQFKNPMALSGIEPATFWLAASCPTLGHIRKNIAHLLLRTKLASYFEQTTLGKKSPLLSVFEYPTGHECRKYV
jgi:hypothetical protein